MKRTYDHMDAKLFRSIGYEDEDFKRPMIGIANSFSEGIPGHINLRQLAEEVKRGIYRAGGNAIEFGVVACCDGIGNSHDGGAYILPSREVIADSIEVKVKTHRLDGIVLMGSCDKIVPGMLMGAARVNIPAILVPGGPMFAGPSFGNKKKTDSTAVMEAIAAYQIGKVDKQEVDNLEVTAFPTCGSCAFYGTANAMSCSAEALGMTMPNGGCAPAVYAERIRVARRTGEQIIELVENDIKARDIINYKSIQNAIAYLMASSGSTNAVLHYAAIAHECGIDVEEIIREFDRQSDIVPQIATMIPACYDHDMVDFFHSGGVMRVMENIKEFLNLDVMTATGKTLGENMAAHNYPYGPAIETCITTVDKPFAPMGSLTIMRGNLAPDSGVAKPSAIAEESRVFTGEAICFDGHDACMKALQERIVKPGHVVVVRYEGPKGGPGMREMLFPLKVIDGQGMARTTAMITDGRFAGANSGCFVGHISPEAAEGGPIALVEDGDQITIDVYKKEITLHVDEKELARRKAKWQYTPKVLDGYLARYAALARSADKGGVLDYRKVLK